MEVAKVTICKTKNCQRSQQRNSCLQRLIMLITIFYCRDFTAVLISRVKYWTSLNHIQRTSLNFSRQMIVSLRHALWTVEFLRSQFQVHYCTYYILLRWLVSYASGACLFICIQTTHRCTLYTFTCHDSEDLADIKDRTWNASFMRCDWLRSNQIWPKDTENE